jgi:hypothetical protein
MERLRGWFSGKLRTPRSERFRTKTNVKLENNSAHLDQVKNAADRRG